MADDPKKKRIDSWFYSANQPHEVAYFKRQISAEFPTKTETQIVDAIDACVQQIAPSEGREKLKDCVHKRLRGY
jgi:hypothetical protein